MNNKKLNIGLQIVSLSNSYTNAIIDYINTTANKLDVNLIIFLGGTPDNPDFEQEHHQKIIYDHINSNNLDAVIILTPTLKNFSSDIDFTQLIQSFNSVPIVSIGIDVSHIVENQTSILVNSETGLIDLIDNLIVENQYKKLAFITGPLINPEALIRFNTYKSKLNQYNIKYNDQYVYNGRFDSSDAKPAIDQFLNNNELPDVIICSNDLAAIAVIEELKSRKFQVPSDIAVTGFDNLDSSKLSSPALSTVAQPYLELGILATELAVKLAKKEPCQDIYHLDSVFIKRLSCESSNLKNTRHSLKETQTQVSNLFIGNQENPANSTTQESNNYYVLLLSIIEIISNCSKLSCNQSIVNFEEFALERLKSKIFHDIRKANGYQQWKNAISSLEQNNDSHLIQLITTDLRTVLYKQYYLSKTSDTSSRDKIYIIKSIIEEISNASSINEISEKIKKHYNQLSQIINLNKYIVLGYPKPIKKRANQKWVSPKSIDLILSFNDQALDNTQRFQSKYIIPEELMPYSSRQTLVVESLYSANDQLGRVIYELYPSEEDLFSCAMINSQISSTLRAIHQNNERIKAKNKISALVKDLKAEKKIAQDAVIAKGQFLATMSHEIRTPMNGVLGISELLKSTNLNDEQSNYLKIIQNSANSLLHIISDILDFSKIEQGKLSVEKISFNLKELCLEVISLLKFNLDQHNLKLILDIQTNTPKYILSDPTRLKQILINLIGNAIKFTTKGSITLKIELLTEHNTDNAKNNTLKFSVTDTGTGISKENINKLFKAFNQADNTITRKFGGTGLGLNISKSLSKLMGGDIGVISKLNIGSTFWFTISSEFDENFIEFHSDSVEKNTSLPDVLSFSDYKILVAEDNKVNQLVIKGMLKKLDANITICENGLDAFNEYEASPNTFDLIIMDFEMPVLDGVSATKKIRALEELNNHTNKTGLRTPIIAITAHAMQEHRDACIESGMDDFLSKPINSDDLYDILVKYLKETK